MPLFAGGMPTVFGGDSNDGETAQQTIVREMLEEIGHDVSQNPPALQQIYQANTKTNAVHTVTETCTFYSSPDIIPAVFALGAPTTEITHTFFLDLDTITVALNSRPAVVQAICAVAHIAININNLSQQQTEFLHSATLSALIALLGAHRNARYDQGLQRAQAGQPATNATITYMAGYNEYTQGQQRAQTGQLAANNTVAYVAGYNEYTQGQQQAQAGHNATSANAAYMIGFNYTQGLQRAQTEQMAASANAAYMAGYNEYAQGQQQARIGQLAANNTVAYMAGYNEYTQGQQQAQAGHNATSANAAYMAGFREAEVDMDTSDD